mgnify:CR=1 FL=1
MKKVLILTHEEDPHSRSVCRYFDQIGVDYFEVLTDKLIGHYDVTFDLSKRFFILSSHERRIELTSDWSIWNRRVMDPTLPASIPSGLEDIVFTETERTWQGLLFTHAGKVVNRPQASFNANNKVDQLLFASKYGHGIKVPKTVLTNNPQDFKTFFAGLPKVSFKLLKAPMIQTNEEGEYLTCYNNIVTSEQAEMAELVRNNPCLFQEYIEKEYELRITALENKIVAIKIDSQKSALSSVDFRRYDFENVTYERVEIPRNVEQFCADMLRHYGLLFAEMDFIRNKDGGYVFLELNPNGQWLWLELKSGYNLSKDVADNLL